MIGFFKKLFGMDKPSETDTTQQAPYKVETPEPAKCGCGRSQTGYCVGLHKLTPAEWSVHADNPNKAPEKAEKPKKAKKPAKPKATKATGEKKPKAPRKKKAAE